jgi:hypothetical protein
MFTLNFAGKKLSIPLRNQLYSQNDSMDPSVTNLISQSEIEQLYSSSQSPLEYRFRDFVLYGENLGPKTQKLVIEKIKLYTGVSTGGSLSAKRVLLTGKHQTMTGTKYHFQLSIAESEVSTYIKLIPLTESGMEEPSMKFSNQIKWDTELILSQHFFNIQLGDDVPDIKFKSITLDGIFSDDKSMGYTSGGNEFLRMNAKTWEK